MTNEELEVMKKKFYPAWIKFAPAVRAAQVFCEDNKREFEVTFTKDGVPIPTYFSYHKPHIRGQINKEPLNITYIKRGYPA